MAYDKKFRGASHPPLDKLQLADQNTVFSMLHRGATRRDVMSWFLAAGATAALSSSLAISSTKAWAQTPKTGGHLRVSGTSQSARDTLDPTKSSYSTDYLRAFTFFDTLVELDITGTPQPRLATQWSSENRARRWIFDLREGVTFHNGKTLTASDVAWSLMRHKDEAVASVASTLAAPIETVTADGPNRVIVDLSAPNADFVRLMALYNFLISAEGETDFSSGNGTGPFIVKEWNPGIRSIGERNPNYFGNVYLDSVEQFAINDPVARVNALISGEIEYALQLDPNSLTAVEAANGVSVFNTRAPAPFGLNMHVDAAPFSNRDFRNAIKYLFDRERIVSSTYKGYAVLGNDHIFHPDSPYYNSSLPQRGLDIDKARSLIKQAGMEGQSIDLHVSDASIGSVDMGLMLQQTAARAGLTLNLRREPNDGYWANIWRKRSFYASNWNPRPIPDVLLSQVYRSDGPLTETNLASPRMDELIDLARETVDEAARKDIYWEIQQIMYEEDGHAWLCFKDFLDGTSDRVKGLVQNPQGPFCGFNFANKVWLES